MLNGPQSHHITSSMECSTITANLQAVGTIWPMFSPEQRWQSRGSLAAHHELTFSSSMIDDETVSLTVHEDVFGEHGTERMADKRCAYLLFYCHTSPIGAS